MPLGCEGIAGGGERRGRKGEGKGWGKMGVRKEWGEERWVQQNAGSCGRVADCEE